jgi:hypothetical protein
MFDLQLCYIERKHSNYLSHVQIAYVQATSLVKYFAVAGDEFGDDKGKTALIARALYGLKSLGASWRAHIAHTLTDMNFTPSHGDPDVWMRMAFN